MTVPALPSQGSTAWYEHYTSLDTEARKVAGKVDTVDAAAIPGGWVSTHPFLGSLDGTTLQWLNSAGAAVPPPTVPNAPTAVTATKGDTQATVSFTAPVPNGVTVTGYRVTSSPGGLTATGAASPITITGLTNLTAYTFTVAANSAGGYGPESAASNSVTPDPGFIAQDNYNRTAALNGSTTSIGAKTWVANAGASTNGTVLTQPTGAASEYTSPYINVGQSDMDVSCVVTAATWEDHGICALTNGVISSQYIRAFLRVGSGNFFVTMHDGTSSSVPVTTSPTVTNGASYTFRLRINATAGTGEAFLNGVKQGSTFAIPVALRNKLFAGVELRTMAVTATYEDFTVKVLV